MKRAVLGLLSLALACAFAIGLGFFSAKEQGPPGLVAPTALNYIDTPTPLLIGAGLAMAAAAFFLATVHLRSRGRVDELMNSLLTFVISLAAAKLAWASKPVPVPHFTNSRLRSV